MPVRRCSNTYLGLTGLGDLRVRGSEGRVFEVTGGEEEEVGRRKSGYGV